jgi:uncharacterized protein YggE
MSKHLVQAAAVLIGVATMSGSAQAQAPTTISVLAEGASTTNPDYVIVKGVVPGRGDTTVKAHEAYEKAKAALEKDFPRGGPLAELKFLGEKFSTAGTGMEGVVMAAPVGGAAPAVEAKPSEIGEKIQFRIDFTSDMDRSQVAQRIASLIDKAAKSGVEFAKPANIYTVAGRAGSTLTEFGIDDPSEASIKACEEAVKQARSKAERLAAAAGGTLDGVVSIEEISADNDPVDSYSTILMLSMGETPPENEFSSEANKPIEIRRRVRVVFGFTPK